MQGNISSASRENIIRDSDTCCWQLNAKVATQQQQLTHWVRWCHHSAHVWSAIQLVCTQRVPYSIDRNMPNRINGLDLTILSLSATVLQNVPVAVFRTNTDFLSSIRLFSCRCAFLLFQRFFSWRPALPRSGSSFRSVSVRGFRWIWWCQIIVLRATMRQKVTMMSNYRCFCTVCTHFTALYGPKSFCRTWWLYLLHFFLSLRRFPFGFRSFLVKTQENATM